MLRVWFPLVCLATVCTLQAAISDELSSAQAAQVAKGGQLVLSEEVEGRPWPKLRIYQQIAATPEEVIAVFFDYKNAKSYIPNLLKSEISKTISPCVLEVDYGVSVPVFSDEYYTARNSLSYNDGIYRVDWVLLRALQTKASEGNLRVEKTGNGSLICYTNLVTPGSKMAGLLRIPAIDQMKNTVQAIVTKVENQKKNNPEELSRQVDALRLALNSNAN